MPRIPSAADVTSIGASSARLATVRASAEDFGLNAAEGLKDLARGIASAGMFLDDLVKAGKKREKAQQSADAGQHVAETRAESNQQLDRWNYDGSSPQEAAAQSSKELEAWEDKRLQLMPSEQRPVLKAATASIRQGHGLRLAQRAQNAAVAALSRQTDETLRLIQEQAVREPEAAAHYAAEGQAQLQSLLEAGALTPEQFAEQKQAFRRALFANVVRGQPAVRALADLEDGIYDAGLDDPALKRALTEETAWRLQSETAQGAAAADAQLARARRGEAAAGDFSASTRAIFAAGEMGDAELQSEIAFRVNSEIQRLRYAPEAEISGRLEDLAPTVGAPDAETRQRIRQEVWTQSQAMLRERRRDPAVYAMGQPAVAEAFAAAAKNHALLPDAIGGRLAVQRAMGLTPEEQNALTLEERERFVAGLRQLPPEQRVAAVMELGVVYGDQAGAVAVDLAEAGLSVDELLAADPSGGPEVTGMLARAAEREVGETVPEVDVVQEFAERLIAEEREARRHATEGEGDGAGVEGLPPLPQRKPVYHSTMHESEKGFAIGGNAGAPAESRYPDINALEMKHRDLLGMSEEEIFKGSTIEEENVLHRGKRLIDLEADLAEVHPLQRKLAKRLFAQGIKEGLGYLPALSEALNESVIRPQALAREGKTLFPSASLDASAYIPDFKGTEAERARQLGAFVMRRQFDLPENIEVPGLYSLVQDFSRVREIYRVEGQLGLEQLKQRLQAVNASLADAGGPTNFGWLMLYWQEDVLARPYKYPQTLTDDELDAAIYFLSNALADSTDLPPWVSGGGLLLSVLPAGKIAQLGSIGASLFGLQSDLDTEKMAHYLSGLNRESSRRRNFLPDSGALKSVGLD